MMRVVAARFSGPEQARAVLHQLQRKLKVDAPDVAVAPLGIPGEAPANEFVLAGRFPDDSVSRVVRLVREAGGEVVADVDESWTDLVGQAHD